MKDEPNIPCIDCVVMAICNANMHKPEKQPGLNAYDIYKKCELIKDYIDTNYVTQVDKNTWKTSFIAIQTFFMGTDYIINPHVISDYIPLVKG